MLARCPLNLTTTQGSVGYYKHLGALKNGLYSLSGDVELRELMSFPKWESDAT